MIYFQQARDRYNFRKARDGYLDPVPDLETGLIHCVAANRKPARGGPAFVATNRYAAWDALCGRRVKAVLEKEFEDSDGEGLCERCVEKLRMIESGNLSVEAIWISRWT